MIFKKLFDLEANQKSRRLFYKIKWYLFSSEMDDPFSGFIRKFEKPEKRRRVFADISLLERSPISGSHPVHEIFIF